MDRHEHPEDGSFKRLRVWQEAFKLAAAVRPVCDTLRRAHRRHLADQLARATTSVHANIAEASGRRTAPDRARVLLIARGSLLEAESLLAEAALYRAARPQTAPCVTHVHHTRLLLAALLRSLKP
jgi:four helix bundle protein